MATFPHRREERRADRTRPDTAFLTIPSRGDTVIGDDVWIGDGTVIAAG